MQYHYLNGKIVSNLVNSENKISIVIVTYNSEKYIEKNIASIIKFNSDLIDQIIVYDSNSSDSTLKIIEENFPQVEIIHGENRGYGYALNQGFKICKNEIMIGSNDDIYFFDNSLKNIYTTFKKYESVGIVGPKILYDDKTLQRSITNNPNIIKDSLQILFPSFINTENKIFRILVSFFQKLLSIGRFDNHKNKKIVTAVKGAFFILRKDVFTATKGFDERIPFDTEEQIFCLRAKNQGWQTFFDPSICIVHIAGLSLGLAGSQENKLRFAVKIQSTLLFYKYYKPFFWYIISYLSFVMSLSIRLIYLSIFRRNTKKNIFYSLKLLLTNKMLYTKIYKD